MDFFSDETPLITSYCTRGNNKHSVTDIYVAECWYTTC